MGFVRCLQTLWSLSQLIPSNLAQKTVNCQSFKFVIDKDVAYNHILEGHVFQRSTVHNATQCHVKCKDDCLCVSMNYFPQSKENNCELNDVNRDIEPAAMKWRQGGNYYDLMRSYTVKVRDGTFVGGTVFVEFFYLLFSVLYIRLQFRLRPCIFLELLSPFFLFFASLLPLSSELFEFKYLFAVDPQNPFSWILSIFVFVFVCQLSKDRFRKSSLF